MLGTKPAQSESVEGSLDLARAAPRLRIIGLAIAWFAVLTGAWYVAQVVVLDHAAFAAVNASVANVNTPLRPDASIQVTAKGAGVDLEGAQLYRADVNPDGSRSAEQPVPIRLEPAAAD